MSAPTLFIPIDGTWAAELAARTAITTGAAAWKLEIDPDGYGYDNYTGTLDNNKLNVSGHAGVFEGAEASECQFVLRNADETFAEGDLGGCAVRVWAKIGAADYLQVFQGFIDAPGASRTKNSFMDDVVAFTAHDLLKSKGVRRHCLSEALVGFKVCDSGTPSASLVHRLAARMGLSSSDLEVVDVDLTKDYVGTSVDDLALAELQDLTAQHGAFLGVRYDGKLRFIVWTAAEWNAATPEYVFGGDLAVADPNAHWGWQGVGGEVFCNRAVTEFSRWEVLTAGSVVYKNYDDWDELTGQNAITVGAGKYWPGGDDGTDDLALGRLEYGYKGERYPVGISIITPTVGATGSGSDIESSGGVLTLVSFNGSTGDTRQNVDSSEIILHNATGSTVTITKLQVRGTPLREKSKNRVEYVDPTMGDEALEVRREIPGKYACTVDQAKSTVKRWVDWGREGRKQYRVTADFTPHVQCGALVEWQPEGGIDVVCQVVGYQHHSEGPHTLTRTELELVERVDKSDAGGGTLAQASPGGEVPSSISKEIPDVADALTHAEDQAGYDAAGGTTTPDTPTITSVEGRGRDLVIWWDRQLELTNLDHYELQVSDDPDAIDYPDAVSWYELEFSGSDWKGALDEVSDFPAEIAVHTNIPLLGTTEDPLERTLFYRVRRVTKAAVLGDWSTAVAGTATPKETGDMAARSVTAEKLTAGLINALIAEITQYLQVSDAGIVGQTFTGSPGLGAQRARLYRNGLIIETYDGTTPYDEAGWQVSLQLGGDENGGFYPLLQARGLIAVGGTADDALLGLGDTIPAGAFRFSFDDTLNDQFSSNPWTQTAGEYTATSKYGTKAWRSTAGNTGTLADADAHGITFAAPWGIDAWLDVTSYQDEDILKLEAVAPDATIVDSGEETPSTSIQTGSLSQATPGFVTMLTDTVGVRCHSRKYTSGSNWVTAFVVTPFTIETDGTCSYGAPVEVYNWTLASGAGTQPSIQYYLPSVTRLTDTEFVVSGLLQRSSVTIGLPEAGRFCLVKCTTDGVTVTADASTTHALAGTGMGTYKGMFITRLDDTTILEVSWQTGENVKARVWDNTLALLGGPTDVFTPTGTGVRLGGVATVSSSKAIMAVNHNSAKSQTVVGIGWDGATITASAAALNLVAAAGVSPGLWVSELNSTSVIAAYVDGDAGFIKMKVVSIDGSLVLSAGAALTTDIDDSLGQNGMGGVVRISAIDGQEVVVLSGAALDGGVRHNYMLWAKSNAGTLAQFGATKDLGTPVGPQHQPCLAQAQGRVQTCHPCVSHDGTKLIRYHPIHLWTRVKMKCVATGSKIRWAMDNWGLAETNETEDLASGGAGYVHVSANFTQSSQLVDGTLGAAGDITGFNHAGDFLHAGACSLTLISNSQRQYWDDLLVSPVTSITVAKSHTHAAATSPWSLMDYEENVDVVVRPRTARASGALGRILRFGDITGHNGRRLALNATGYTVLLTDGYELIEDATGASDQTVTMPDLVLSAGRAPILFVKTDAGAGKLIVARAGANTFDGAATSVQLTTQYDAALIWPGSDVWRVLHVNPRPTDIVASGTSGFTGGAHTHALAADSVTANEIAADAVGQSEIAAAAVGQGELKTSSGTLATASGASPRTINGVLPGGEYGFYPRSHVNDTTTAVSLVSSTYTLTTSAALGIGRQAIWSGTPTNRVLTLTQRYITASGEVFWIFRQRHKVTGEWGMTWAAPDHPCFGNGGDPVKLPHPFPADPDYEVVVVNPTAEQIACAHDLEEADGCSVMEALDRLYEVDDRKEVAWPDEPVSVKLLSDWDHLYRTGVKKVPIKKMSIPKPAGVKCYAFKSKKGE